MNRNDARALWAASGLTYAVLTKENLERLKALLDTELRASGLFRGTYRMSGKIDLHTGLKQPWAAVWCEAYYFKGHYRREAVTFNPDGFVGYAGWADDDNVVPVLKGFERWVSEMSTPAMEGC